MIARRDLASVTCLALLVLGLAGAVWLSGRVFLPHHPASRDLPWARSQPSAEVAGQPDNHAFDDKLRVIYPDLVHDLRSLRHGALPLWNPWILGGVPHAANPMTAAFYPPRWLLAFGDEREAPLWSAALHVLLAALGMYAFLRIGGTGALAALLGAIGMAFSGWVTAHLQNTPLVAVVSWAPIGLLGIEARLRRRHLPWRLLLALGVGMPWLAGFPQLAAIVDLALLAYAAVGIAARGSGRLHRAGDLLVAMGLGVLLASVQLVPTSMARAEAARGSRTVDDLVGERYRTSAWIGVLLPRTLGDPRQSGDWRDGPRARAWLGEGADHRPPQVASWSERTVYPSVLVLLLAAIGASLGRGPPRAAALVLLGLGIVLAASRTCIAVYGRLPGFDFGAPARMVWLAVLALPILAAIGLDRLMRRPSSMPMRIGLALAAGGACAVATFVDADALDRAILVLGAVTLFALADLRARGRITASALGGAIVALTLADLLAFLVPFDLPVTAHGLYLPTPALQFLAEHLGDGRMLRVSEDRAGSVADRIALLHPDQGVLFGLRDAQGYRELAPERWLDPWRGKTGLWTPVGFSGITADFADDPLLDLASVRYLIAAHPIATLEDRRVHPRGDAPADLWIYRNPGALPRARLVRGPIPATPSVGPAAAGTVTITRDSDDEVVLDVVAEEDCHVVLADTWFPGWQAWLGDGNATREVPIECAYGMVRAVAVARGRHTLRFVYRPASVRWGAALSVLALVLLLGSRARSGGW